MAHTVILGIGNCLQSDLGTGVHAAHRLQERAGRDERLAIIDAGLLEFPLLSTLADADGLIAIAAAPTGGTPGRVVVHEGAEFDRHLELAALPEHAPGLRALVERARAEGVLPVRRVLIGIEPECLDWGLVMSPRVAAALPGCLDLALGYVERWRAHPPPCDATPREARSAA